jgi:hypothetical protein
MKKIMNLKFILIAGTLFFSLGIVVTAMIFNVTVGSLLFGAFD